MWNRDKLHQLVLITNVLNVNGSTHCDGKGRCDVSDSAKLACGAPLKIIAKTRFHRDKSTHINFGRRSNFMESAAANAARHTSC